MGQIIELKDFEDRFWNRVDVKSIDECWNWLGQPNGSGYGRINIYGKFFLVHRVSWSLLNGDIPNNRMICHTCDNRLCVNPKHLYLGTYSDNALDRERRLRKEGISHNGRSPKINYIGEMWLIDKLHKAKIDRDIICKMFKIKKSLFYQVLKEYNKEIIWPTIR